MRVIVALVVRFCVYNIPMYDYNIRTNVASVAVDEIIIDLACIIYICTSSELLGN